MPPAWTDPTDPTGQPGCCPLPRGRTASEPPGPRAAVTAIKRAIARARSKHQITAREAERYKRIYSAARHSRADMRGGRSRDELVSVLATLDRIAGAGKLNATRMPALFLQLRRNREFWTGHPKISAGSRVIFEGTQLLFQYYPGQGMQIQPLGNFGRANGLYTACTTHQGGCDKRALRKLLDELVAIRSNRGGAAAWEYWFSFGGGAPPWASGMANATAVQALARGSRYFGVRRYMKVARRALGLFRESPPRGVRASGLGGGVHYVLYSFAPGLRVLNGFAQALNGLYDFHLLSKDKRALRLFKAGDRSMRREMPRYDTGDWTLYSLGGSEASREYHELSTGFIAHICKRSKIDFYCRYARRFERYLSSRGHR